MTAEDAPPCIRWSPTERTLFREYLPGRHEYLYSGGEALDIPADVVELRAASPLLSDPSPEEYLRVRHALDDVCRVLEERGHVVDRAHPAASVRAALRGPKPALRPVRLRVSPDEKCEWSGDSSNHAPGLGRDREECRFCDGWMGDAPTADEARADAAGKVPTDG